MEALNVIDYLSPSFNGAVGISEERATELSKKLNEMSASFLGQTVRVVDIFNEILTFCDNKEELIYCTINHCNYMAMKHGIFLCPPESKQKI